ncbi:MAG: glycoside hydrolase family 88 protein [Niabella sp.]
MSIITIVNNHWQASHPNPGNSFWDNAAYQTGNMAAYTITKNEAYKQYAEKWATQNKWMGATGTDKSKWKYTYGETQDYVLFGDWQIAFQTYIDLYNMDAIKVPKKIARAKEVMEYEMSTVNNDYWWWVDGLYMVMPVMTKLYHATNNNLYLIKLWEYFNFADSLMYDNEENLFYRDKKYIYPQHKTINGKKDFWARGNGWVFAALAKVLNDLPKSDTHYDYYLQKYISLAQALKKCQHLEGYWTRSLADEQHAPGPETSGTAFFTYAYAWGLNQKILNKKEYLPILNKAWQYLTKVALQPDGAIGYVQPIGEKAIPGQTLKETSTANFGVGAFLLAASEIYHLAQK